MGHRLSRIVTRTGDDGTTGLADGQRVNKDSTRIEACGTVDELNCAIGILLADTSLPDDIVQCLVECQHELFDLGGELASPGSQVVGPQHVHDKSAIIDDLSQRLNVDARNHGALLVHSRSNAPAAVAYCPI